MLRGDAVRLCLLLKELSASLKENELLIAQRPHSVSETYDASGSFLSKSDYASQYNYHASRPHVITSVTLIGGGDVTPDLSCTGV